MYNPIKISDPVIVEVAMAGACFSRPGPEFNATRNI